MLSAMKWVKVDCALTQVLGLQYIWKVRMCKQISLKLSVPLGPRVRKPLR